MVNSLKVGSSVVTSGGIAGKVVKSGRFKFNVGDISFVESGIQKFTESDPGHYASIMSSNGVEIGRGMGVYRDKKKMVKYLSDLFGVS